MFLTIVNNDIAFHRTFSTLHLSCGSTLMENKIFAKQIVILINYEGKWTVEAKKRIDIWSRCFLVYTKGPHLARPFLRIN